MKRITSLLMVALLIFGFSGALFAQEDGIMGPELGLEEVPLQGAVDVEFTDLAGNPITTIQRGNPVRVEASHVLAGPPLQATCVLILPVNAPQYKEMALFSRTYQGSAWGEEFYFYIPAWVQIEGTAIAVVVVQGAGAGFAILQVTP